MEKRQIINKKYKPKPTKLAKNEQAMRWVDVMGCFIYDDDTLQEVYSLINADANKMKENKPHTMALVTLYEVTRRRNLKFDFKSIENIMGAKRRQINRKQYDGLKLSNLKIMVRKLYGNKITNNNPQPAGRPQTNGSTGEFGGSENIL